VVFDKNVGEMNSSCEKQEINSIAFEVEDDQQSEDAQPNSPSRPSKRARLIQVTQFKT